MVTTGGCVTAHLRQRALAVVSGHGLVLVERPAHLFLQRSIVFDDEQIR
jgi:hypothetical protein